MAKIRHYQFTEIPQESVVGLSVELKQKATISLHDDALYVSTLSGSDTNVGSREFPKKTIQAAVDSLPLIINHPTEIILDKGIYTETVLFTRHILGAKGFIIIKPLDNATVVLSGDKNLDHCLVVDFAQGVCVQDITIQGYRKEAVKVINSAKIDMNRCVIRDNYIGLSISNQASTYALNSCVFLNNSVGLKVFNTSNAELLDSSFESNKIAVSVDSLSNVSLKGARVSSNRLAFESLGKSLLELQSSVVTENDNVAKVDLSTLSSRNLDKSTLISNNIMGLLGTKTATIDLQNVDLVNNKSEDVRIDSGSVAILDNCNLRKSSSSYILSAQRGTQIHLIGHTRDRASSGRLYDPNQESYIFG